MSFLLGTILSFFAQAFALKFALDLTGKTGQDNTLSKAAGVSVALGVASFVLGFVPIFGHLLYLGLWIAVIMVTYELQFTKSLLVGVMQFFVRAAIGLLLWLVGISVAASGAALSFGF